MTTDTLQQILAGGEFLFKEQQPEALFFPEQFSEEQEQIFNLCREFIQQEVVPVLDRLDKQEEGLMESLLDKAGELGLLGAALPEKYGGMGLDVVSSMLIQEGLGDGHAFATAFAAHSGIGMYPIQYFGTEEQRKAYLPGMADGSIKPCYNLTEPNAGSDAMSGKTRADMSRDGNSYVLNGQKCWITNSGFADLFVVFAKMGGEQMTCFLVPKDTDGLTLGPEEHKMGIKGSSTRQVYYNQVKVPKENVVGDIGRGHKIAFNALNIGRIKLGAAALGAAKRALKLSIDYANQREQFRTRLRKFGAIQYKLSEMAIRSYALESALYRTAQDIERKEKALLAMGKTESEALLGAAEEYAAECALLKTYGAEVQDYCVDEGVQIHGGNGFSAEYPIERCYRDSRITRIYEGTNEINRLFAISLMFKRAATGHICMSDPWKKVAGETIEPLGSGAGASEIVSRLKKATLLIMQTVRKASGDKLRRRQQLSMNMADMLLEVFLAEAAVQRSEKAFESRNSYADLFQAASEVFVADVASRMAKYGRDALTSCPEMKDIEANLHKLQLLTAVPYWNLADRRIMISEALCEKEGYIFR
ncbi:MAG: acyl-CoA dehydrogenase family protein [Bacteroidota bacterium]